MAMKLTNQELELKRRILEMKDIRFLKLMYEIFNTKEWPKDEYKNKMFIGQKFGFDNGSNYLLPDLDEPDYFEALALPADSEDCDHPARQDDFLEQGICEKCSTKVCCTHKNAICPICGNLVACT